MPDTGEKKLRDTQPRTLSGVPRVEGVAPETPQEDIRNALAILINNGVPHEDNVQSASLLDYSAADIAAVIRRLNNAVYKLEKNR